MLLTGVVVVAVPVASRVATQFCDLFEVASLAGAAELPTDCCPTLWRRVSKKFCRESGWVGVQVTGICVTTVEVIPD